MKKLSRVVVCIICVFVLIGGHVAYASKKGLIIPLYNAPQVIDPGDEQDPGVIKITKSFVVNGSDKVILNNQYGTLNVRTWNKNEVRLDVVVYGSPELDARQLSEMVALNTVKKDGSVLLETRLTGSRRKNGKKIRVEFQVYMPENNHLTLSHQYGNVNIGDFIGSVVARVRYGNFVAGDLKGENNDLAIGYGSTVIKNINKAKISQEYGDGLTIGTVGTLSLNAGYAAVRINTISEKASITQQYGAGLSIGTVGQLNLNAAYANVQIGTIRVAGKLSHQYSDLNIGAANRLDLYAQYSNVKIGRLNGDSKLNIQYDNLNIDDVGADCQSLIAECAYVKSVIKFNDNYNGSLDAFASYSPFKYGPRILVKVEENKQEKRYAGKIGAGGNSKVKLVSRYGSFAVD